MMETEDMPGELMYYSSGDEEPADERKHNQLLDAISALDGKKKKQLSQRTVISNQISEFNFTSGKDEGSKVDLSELVGSLKDSGRHGDLKKQLTNVRSNNQIVSVPLPKHEKQKIDRSTAYEETTVDLSKWDPIVKQNRKAEQLQFPLKKQDFQVVTTDQLVKRFTPRTPLEMQVAAMLQGSDHVIKNLKQELTPAEQRALKAMDLQEAKERREELMKHRALLSYKEAKAKRQKKIKSKRYHRILKKEKLKTEHKYLEKLRQEDPEEFLEKMNRFEKDRATERASLKHRGGSKYAKRQMIYAKFDDKARQEVQDMLQKSRELTAKLQAQSDDDDDEPDDDTPAPGLHTGGDTHYTVPDRDTPVTDSKNPWMSKPNVMIRVKPGVEAASEYSRPSVMMNEEAEEEDDSAEEGNEISQPSDNNANSNYLKSDDDDDDEEEETNDEEKSPLKSVSSKKKTGDVHNIKQKVQKKKSTVAVNEDHSDVGELDAIDEIFEHSPAKKAKSGRKRGKKNKNKNTEKMSAQGSVSQKESVIETEEIPENDDDDDNSNDEMMNEGLLRKTTLEEYDSLANQAAETGTKSRKNTSQKKARMEKKSAGKKTAPQKDAYIDPKKLLTVETKLKPTGVLPTLADNEDEDDEMDAEEQQRMTIAQAFADDDVIEEFSSEKQATVEAAKPKDIDLTLPGWGSWGGDGIKVSARKRKRFTIKAPPALPRKDEQLGHVILNEKKSEAVKKYQVSEIPFPYRNAEQFEKSIQAPIGKTWNPESVYRQLVKPKVVTHSGKIITPMDKSDIFKSQKQKTDSLPGKKTDEQTDSNKFKRSKKDNKKHKGKSNRKKKA